MVKADRIDNDHRPVHEAFCRSGHRHTAIDQHAMTRDEGSGLKGHEYSFRDVPPRPGVYFYLLEELETNGTKNHYGTIRVEYGDPNLWDLDGDKYIAALDCNDLDPAVNPGAREIRDGIDNDCDGLIDIPRRRFRFPRALFERDR